MSSSAVVVARAPLRVSLAGGGTDLPSYADRYGGLVVGAAIDRYVGVTVFPRAFGGVVRVCGDDVDVAAEVAAVRNRYARAALRRAGVPGNVQVTTWSDAPSGAGLGGSGAFTVALLHALRHAERPGEYALAEEASQIEMADLSRPVGKQDHYLAAYGGLRVLRVDRARRVRVETLEAPPRVGEYVRERLLLFHTGVVRDAGRTLAAQAELTKRGEEQTVRSLHRIRGLADEMLQIVAAGRVDDIGPAMHEHWRHKARLSGAVSNGRIDALYRVAIDSGSDGGKLLGAGGGGFLLLSAKRGAVADLRAAMRAEALVELPFGMAEAGSRATSWPL
ncbi:GHMP family kinase ATP-binding protein [Micromonospora sp. CPCC 206061]|uniref:GHMP family kinase ATP-binding protein n=1 Tax=Micromonospora sp. CPCC 206061 TaxID=3122410 RepID=UPI002FF2EF57